MPILTKAQHITNKQRFFWLLNGWDSCKNGTRVISSAVSRSWSWQIMHLRLIRSQNIGSGGSHTSWGILPLEEACAYAYT